MISKMVFKTCLDFVQVPRGVIHFSFWARNLGLITSLRLGHDNAGLTPNWLVEHVLVSVSLAPRRCTTYSLPRFEMSSLDTVSSSNAAAG